MGRVLYNEPGESAVATEKTMQRRGSVVATSFYWYQVGTTVCGKSVPWLHCMRMVRYVPVRYGLQYVRLASTKNNPDLRTVC